MSPTESKRFPRAIQQMFAQALTILSPHFPDVESIIEQGIRILTPRLSEKTIGQWLSTGIQLAKGHGKGWESALEFFKATLALTEQSLSSLEPWAEYGTRFVASSPALATEYFRMSPFLSQHLDGTLLIKWAQQGEKLLATRQWQAPQIATRYFEVSGEVVSYLSWPEILCWSEITQLLATQHPELALEYLAISSSILKHMPNEGRQEFLELLKMAGMHSAGQVLSLFRKADFVLRHIPSGCRKQVLEIAHFFAKEGGGYLEEYLKDMPSLLQDSPPLAHGELCETLLRIVRIDLQSALAFLRALPTILDQMSWRDLPRWAEPGVALLKESPPKGRAYFSLESSTSRLVLQQLGKTVYLEDVRRLLHLYITGLIGQSIPIRSLTELPPAFRLSQPDRPTTDGEIIYLPAQMDQGSTPVENFMLYKVAAAHQAGHFEFGTFRFSLEKLLEPAPHLRSFFVNGGKGEKGIRSDFEKYFQAFPKRPLAQDIFALLEYGRISHALWRAYRGLRSDLTKAIELAFAARGDTHSLSLQQMMVELLAWLLFERDLPATVPPFIHSLLLPLQHQVTRLAFEEATVQDTAWATLQIYQIIERLPNVPLQKILASQEQTAPEEILNPFANLDLENLSAHLPDSVSPFFAEEEPYQSQDPFLFQGEIKPDLIQQKMKVEELREKMKDIHGGYIPPEILKELLEKGVEFQIKGVQNQPLDITSGLFVHNLEGRGLTEDFRKHLQEKITQLGEEIQAEFQLFQDQGEQVYSYDEWDYQIRDYRIRWCQLRERVPEGTGDGCVAKTLEEHGRLIQQVRKQFELLKPELFKKLKRLHDGEEVDLDAAIEALVDRRAGLPPSEKVYMKRDKRERDIATVFLLDISASTDDIITEETPSKVPSNFSIPPQHDTSKFSGFLRDDFYAPLFAQESSKPQGKRIIDVEREAVIIMAEALESVGDEYAIYGFSGYGRDNVEFFILKEFGETYSLEVKHRIDALKPQRSTRMGPAIRHVLRKFSASPARMKLLILLSDGYPQDFDYGKDRRGKTYGIHDTMMALQEGRKQGIHTFCITVDREGKDYLAEMCGEGNYVVIEEVTSLPQELLKIYHGLTT